MPAALIPHCRISHPQKLILAMGTFQFLHIRMTENRYLAPTFSAAMWILLVDILSQIQKVKRISRPQLA